MNQKNMPLIEALERHKKKNPVSFHVPGHKNGEIYFSADLSYDLTELNGLDDLHFPEGCILDAEKLLTELYQTKESKFLINGSTVGNLAMVLGTLSEGDVVFVQRNCHKSILNALKMAKAIPVFLNPNYDEKTKSAVLFSASTLKQAYAQYKRARAVIFTYPTYYGMTDSFKTLSAIAKENGSLVLVDEAHGAHFVLPYGDIPDSSLYSGADLVVQSAHKMLPAITMGSYFHIQSDKIDREQVMFYLQALQSSSPSYLIMASLDAARAYTAAYKECDAHYSIQVVNHVKAVLERKGCTCISADDPYKLIVRADGLSGFELQTLFEQADIYIEMADPFQVLLLFPLVKKGHSSFEESVLKKLAFFQLEKGAMKEDFPFQQKTVSVSKLALPYNEHSQYKREFVSFSEAEGQVAAETIIPYPPGIPFLMEGEQITAGHIKSIKWMMASGTRFHGGRGIMNNQIAVFKRGGI